MWQWVTWVCCFFSQKGWLDGQGLKWPQQQCSALPGRMLLDLLHWLLPGFRHHLVYLYSSSKQQQKMLTCLCFSIWIRCSITYIELREETLKYLIFIGSGFARLFTKSSAVNTTWILHCIAWVQYKYWMSIRDNRKGRRNTKLEKSLQNE